MNDSNNGSSYQQLELPINIPPPLPKIPSNYDFSWDKPDTRVPLYAPECVREQVEFNTKRDNINSEESKTLTNGASPTPQPGSFHHSIKPGTDPKVAPEHDQCVREQLFGKSAPEHKPLENQWVEEYWVRRSGKEYYYYRYCWMEGRKIRHKHIGGGKSSSVTAIHRKLMVEARLGTTHPSDIVALIDSFKHTNS